MNPQLVDATDLHQLSDRLEARGLLPHVVRRLLASTPGVTRLVLPAEEGVAAPGYDGRVDGGAGTVWVPAGLSVWEMGANQDPKTKAQGDYDTRTKDPGTAVPRDTVFVFVTSRRWAAGQDWAVERRKDNVWRDVVVLDAERLLGWLEQAPDVHVWLSERLGRIPLRIKTLDRAFEQIAARTRPALPPDLLLAGRAAEAEAVIQALASSARVIAVQGGSREEALAFVAAAIAELPDAEDHQPLVVGDAEALERLALSERPLILVLADTDGAEVGDAVAHGHRVVLTLGAGDHVTSGCIVLPRPERTAAADALIAAGVPWDTAHRRAGLARRSFSALQRDMAVSPGGARPVWAAGDDAPLLCALLLLGGWDVTDGDADVVAAVTGLELAAVEARLLAYVGSDDAPWARSAGAWHLVSPEDSWALLHHLLTEGLLTEWQTQAHAVLSEIDPRLGFDMSERLIADIAGEHRARYSQRLRDGIAQASALLSGRGDHASPTGLLPANFSVEMVDRLLDAANQEPADGLWSSLSPQLPSLAEAAPDAFLDAVARGLEMEPSPVLAMFADGPESSPITSPSSPHTGLLWALEGVAWSPDHLVRALMVLGELAARAPSGRTGNRPEASLRAILLPWYPQTGATPARRLEALDALRERHPGVAWDLELMLLPRMHGSSSRTHLPRFRDWAADREESSATRDEDHIAALAERVGDDAGDDPARWAEVVPLVRALPAAPRDALLDRVGGLDAEAMDAGRKLVLWRALVDEAETHQSFADAVWSLGEPYSERLMALSTRFENPDPPERHARLFDYRARMPGVPRDDYTGQREAVASAQQAAATEVYDRDGLGGLKRLADASKLPQAVGAAHAAGRRDADAETLMASLGVGGPTGLMAVGWAARRAHDAGPEWAKERLAALDALPPEAQANFLLQLEPTQAIWEEIDRLDTDVQGLYWRSLNPYAMLAGDMTAGVERMLINGRPWGAIDLLAGSVHDGGDIDVALADKVLRAAAASDEIDAAMGGYEIGQVLDAMERCGADVELLAGHEFAFFALLDQERRPRALTAAVAENPAVFVGLVRRAYGRKDGADEPDVPPDPASHTWQVLIGLSAVPGSVESGVDVEALRAWVHAAREMLKEVDRTEVGDECIGELLSRAPAENDDVWPPVAVREVIEDVKSEHLERGLANGHIRARGVTMRGVYDGGRQERDIAIGLQRGAAALDVSWGRAARMLRSLASTYESFAEREDRQAQHAADED